MLHSREEEYICFPYNQEMSTSMENYSFSVDGYTIIVKLDSLIINATYFSFIEIIFRG